MLESLKLLGSVSKINSPSLLNLLGSTMIDKGSMAYCLGNPSIARQLRFWVKKEAEALGKPIPKDMFTKKRTEAKMEVMKKARKESLNSSTKVVKKRIPQSNIKLLGRLICQEESKTNSLPRARRRGSRRPVQPSKTRSSFTSSATTSHLHQT